MLIVQTQDKIETLKIDNFYMQVIPPTNNHYRIVTQNKDVKVLGTYKTKKRTLEVVEEMNQAVEFQNAKCNTRVVDINGNTIKNLLSNHMFKIYRMPEK